MEEAAGGGAPSGAEDSANRGAHVASPTPSGRGVLYGLWLFVAQLYALCWKHFLLKRRRSMSTLFEIASPALVLLVMVYGVQLSPERVVPAFIHAQIPRVSTNATADVPPGGATSQSIAYMQQVLAQAHLYDAASPRSYFETAIMPLLSDDSTSISNAVQKVSMADGTAATPFVLPSFDAFKDVIRGLRTQLARAGQKHLQHTVPLAWHIMNLGKIAVAPATEPLAVEFIRYMCRVSFEFCDDLLDNRLSMNTIADVTGLFVSVEEAITAAERENAPLWVVISFDRVDVDKAELDFTIRVNSTLVPDTTDVEEQFPQGLGEKYKQYIFSGFATLQHEVSDFFARSTRKLPTRMRPGLVPLMLSSCGALVEAPLMFAQPSESEQRALLAGILATPPDPKVSVVPVAAFTANRPCLLERHWNCSHATAPEDVSACLRNLLTASPETMDGSSCKAAIEFADRCGSSVLAHCNVTEDKFISGDATSVVKCILAVAHSGGGTFPAACTSAAASAYIRNAEIARTFSTPCSSVIAAHCAHVPLTDDAEMRRCLTGAAPRDGMCAAALEAVTSCSDDLATVCPYTLINSFPSMCLHEQRALLSTWCLDSHLMTSFIDPVVSMNVTIATPNPHEYVCRNARKVDSAFESAIAAGAFPALSFNKNLFFENSAALIGLVLAMAFVYPFTATIRITVQERERKQRMLLLCAGVPHGTLMVCYVLMGVLIMAGASLLAAIVLGGVLVRVPAGLIFTLVFSYGVSLVGCAQLIASFFNASRTAAAAAPFVLFMMAVPAFATAGQVVWFGSVLAPSTLVLAVGYMTAFSQSSASLSDLEAKVTAASMVQFGLFIAYVVVALLVEQLRVFVATGDGIIGSATGKLRRSYRQQLARASSPVRRSRAYSTLSFQDRTGATMGRNRGVARPSNPLLHSEMESLAGDEGTASSLLHAESGAANGTPGDDDDDGRCADAAEVGAVSGILMNDGDPQAESGENGAPKSDNTSCAGNDADAEREDDDVFSALDRLPEAEPFLTTSELCLSFQNESRVTVSLKRLSTTFFLNCVNCVVGPSGSGKSSLMSLLAGTLAPTSGGMDVGGVPVSKFDRQEMGVCFHDDVFWDCLSVSEHIELMQLLKGNIQHDHMTQESNTLMRALGLYDKRDDWASVLPRGFRRRMCVATAFAGGSRVVLLDEPTGACDAIARDDVWRMLHANEAGRCIIVSTSSVEEAEFAGHVLMLNAGESVCDGTPAAVKQRLTTGGHRAHCLMKLCRAHHTASRVVISSIREINSSAILIGNVGLELSFKLPMHSEADVAASVSLVEQVEQNADTIGLTSVSVMDPPLEELFISTVRLPKGAFTSGAAAALLCSEGASDDDDDGGNGESAKSHVDAVHRRELQAYGDIHQAEKASLRIGSDVERKQRAHGARLFVQVFTAMLMKRFICAFHARHTLIQDALFPLLCVVIAMSMLNLSAQHPPSRVLTPSMFDGNDRHNEVLLGDATSQQAFAKVLDNRRVFGVRFSATNATTSVNMSAQLQREAPRHRRTRFGAVIFNDTFANFDRVEYAWNGTASVPLTGVPPVFTWYVDTVLHNTTSPHAIPAFLGLLENIRMWRAQPSWGAGGSGTEGGMRGVIRVKSHPLPAKVMVFNVVRAVLDLLGSVLLLLPFTFFPAMYVSYVVRERESGFLTLQLGSSLSGAAYWLAMFTWSIACFAIMAVLILLAFVAFRRDVLQSMGDACLVYALIIMYGCAATSMSFLISKAFRRHTTAQNAVTLLHFISGFVLVTAAYAIELLPDASDTAKAKRTNQRLMRFFRLWPAFGMGECFVNLASMPLLKLLNQNRTVPDLVVPALQFMAMFPLYLVLLIAYERFVALSSVVRRAKDFSIGRFFKRRVFRTRGPERWETPAEGQALAMCDMIAPADGQSGVEGGSESDTVPTGGGAGEARDGVRVPSFYDQSRLSGSFANSGPIFSLKNIWKRFSGRNTNHSFSTFALSDVSLDVARGEHVVIVGVNGSGKSTLLNCCMALTTPAHGEIDFEGQSLLSPGGFAAARANIGFSASPSALPEYMTPYHLLHLMADLRGMPTVREREQHIFFLLNVLGLMHSRHTLIKHMSEGNRSRVAVGMSLVGYPRLLLLDEVNAGGLDAIGRRQVWAALRTAPRATCWVSTTQHLDEAATLGTRLVVLDRGVCRFHGTFVDARRRHGWGYSVILRLPRSAAAATLSTELVRFVAASVPGAQLVERRFGGMYLVMWVPACEPGDARAPPTAAAAEAVPPPTISTLVALLWRKQQQSIACDASVAASSDVCGVKSFEFSVSTENPTRLLLSFGVAAAEGAAHGMSADSLRVDVRRPVGAK